jgi:hypothetical protein
MDTAADGKVDVGPACSRHAGLAQHCPAGGQVAEKHVTMMRMGHAKHWLHKSRLVVDV